MTVMNVLESVRVPDVDTPCRQDPDLWFAENGREVEQAKGLCHTCPIRRQCLAGALARGEPWGVWGGEVFADGMVLAHKRGRGRPRNDDPHAPWRHRASTA